MTSGALGWGFSHSAWGWGEGEQGLLQGPRGAHSHLFTHDTLPTPYQVIRKPEPHVPHPGFTPLILATDLALGFLSLGANSPSQTPLLGRS